MSANDYAHRQLTRVVAGAVEDAFKNHPDYLTPRGKRSAKGSIVKRVTGTVLSFAVQAARGRVRPAFQGQEPRQAQVPASDVLASDAGAGALLRQPLPNPHCRIRRVRFKRLRAPDGRFISRRTDTHDKLSRLVSLLTPEQRQQAKARAAAKGGV